MAVYYKFKSAKDYDSIAIDGHFIAVGNLKEKIFESKQLGRGTDFDLVITNAQTNEEYPDESMLIPKNTSVLVRRVPGRRGLPIVTASVPEPDEPKVEDESEDVQTAKSGFIGVDTSAMKYPDDSEYDVFGNDLYAIPESLPVQSTNAVQDAPPSSNIDEDSKIKALIDTPALDWQRQSSDGFGPGRGFGRGIGGRMMGGRGFGRGGLERKTPPQGYICHRCKVPGHFIQHCPTNGDPNYDVKRVKPPTGIPKSMLMATPDGSYALPSGAAAVLRPNEAAFEKEIDGLPSTARSIGDFPPELHCPLCKEVMKDAVLTSKCCFTSFCDKCIRDHIISKSMCVCGAANVLADDLLPNKTLRDTINRIMESNNSSAENGGSAFHVQDMESRNPQPKVPSPTQSVASKGEQMPPAAKKEVVVTVHEVAEEDKASGAPHQTLEKIRVPKVADASEATHESASVKEPASQGSAPMVDEEVQQKLVTGEAAKKKKKKKARMLPNAAEMHWRATQDLAAENYMMPMAPAAYNPYWTGIQPGMEGFMPPYGGVVPYMGFGMGPLDMPFGGMLPQGPFAGQGCMLPFGPPPPQRDLADFGLGFNRGPPLMSRGEFEARKSDLKRKREIERRGDSREMLRDRDFGREVSSSGDISMMKSKSKAGPPPSGSDHHHHHQRTERPPPEPRSRNPELPPPSPEPLSRNSELPRPSSKRKSDYDNDDRDRDEQKRHRSHRDEPYSEDHHRRHHDYSDDPSLKSRKDYPDDRHHREEYHHRSSHPPRSGSTSKPTPEPPAAPATSSMPSSSAAADKKSKASVFSRISFPAEEQAASKKRKLSSSDAAAATAPESHKGTSNGYHESSHKASSSSRKSAAALAAVSADNDSSDEDRHFKRKPSRYASSPPAPAADAAEPRGSRDRERGREREREKEVGGYSSKHRKG